MIEVSETIKLECLEMQRFLEEQASNDPNELAERLGKTNIYLARSGMLLAEVKRIQEQEQRHIFDCYSEYIQGLKSTIASKFIDANLADVNYYVTWLDRLNRGFVHSGDNLRTLMSFAKEELKLQRSGY